jgi:hypothetical protein
VRTSCWCSEGTWTGSASVSCGRSGGSVQKSSTRRRCIFSNVLIFRMCVVCAAAVTVGGATGSKGNAAGFGGVARRPSLSLTPRLRFLRVLLHQLRGQFKRAAAAPPIPFFYFCDILKNNKHAPVAWPVAWPVASFAAPLRGHFKRGRFGQR